MKLLANKNMFILNKIKLNDIFPAVYFKQDLQVLRFLKRLGIVVYIRAWEQMLYTIILNYEP